MPPSCILPSCSRGSRNGRASVLLFRRLGWRNLRRQRKNPLIVERQHLEEPPLPGIGKCRPLVLPQVVADNLVRTSGATCEMGIDDFRSAELHGADLIGARHVGLM